jgi:hypothetical protein
MKRIYIQAVSVILLVTALLACKKDGDQVLPTASLTIRNCLTDGTVLFPKFNGSENVSFANLADGIASQYNVLPIIHRSFGFPEGNLSTRLFSYPDSVNSISSSSYSLTAGVIYSLFLAGTKDAIDTLFIKEDVPYVKLADSIILFKVVNLARINVPLNLSITGKSANSELQNLSFRKVTKFLQYSVKKSQHSSGNIFSFQVRDATSNTLLTAFNYTWHFPNGAGGSGNNFLSKGATIVLVNTSPNTVRAIIFNPRT